MTISERIWVHGVTGYIHHLKPEHEWEYQDYVRGDLHDALAAENEALRDEVERTKKWLGQSQSNFDSLSDDYQIVRAERDQALAQLAAVQIHMRERAAVKCREDQGRFDTPDRIRAIPLDPDAEAALKRHDAALIERCADVAEDYCSDMPDLAGHGHSIGIKDAIRALARPTEGNEK